MDKNSNTGIQAKPSITDWIGSHILATLVSLVFWLTTYHFLWNLDRHIFKLGVTPSRQLAQTTELVIPYVLSTLIFSLIFFRPLRICFFHGRIAVAITAVLSPYITASLIVFSSCSKFRLYDCHYLPPLVFWGCTIFLGSTITSVLISLTLFRSITAVYLKSLAVATALCLYLAAVAFAGALIYGLFFNIVASPDAFFLGRLFYFLVISLWVTIPCSILSLILGYVSGAALVSVSKDLFRPVFLKKADINQHILG